MIRTMRLSPKTVDLGCIVPGDVLLRGARLLRAFVCFVPCLAVLVGLQILPTQLHPATWPAILFHTAFVGGISVVMSGLRSKILWGERQPQTATVPAVALPMSGGKP
jgi:hypothetical protein